MPQVEVKYSSNLDVNTAAIFEEIEKIISTHDPSAGECKSRAYPAGEYLHSHVLISIKMLRKEHRDEIFTNKLLKDLESKLKKLLTQDSFFSLSLDYNLNYYITNEVKLN